MGIKENMQPLEWAVTIPFVIITACSCLLRFYSRAFVAKSFGLDDWFMVAGSIVWCGQQYIAWMWLILGGGKHIDDVPTANVAAISKYLFVEEFYYLLLQFFIKMSFLLFYRRLLTTSQTYTRVIYTVMCMVAYQTVRTWIFYGLQCIPIDAYFHPELYPNAKCVASDISYYLPSVANVTMDVIIYILPIYPLWHLQATLRRRLGLIAVFTMGGGAVLVSLLRFIVLYQLAHTPDTTYIFGSVCIVTTIEFCSAIITANMPAVRAVYKAHISGQSSSKGTKSSFHEMGNMSKISRNMKARQKMNEANHEDEREV